MIPSTSKVQAKKLSSIDSGSPVPDCPNFSKYLYRKIVDLPPKYTIHDFTRAEYSSSSNESDFSIGRYDEKRENMYKGELFEKEQRNIHVGIDIGGPVGTKIKSFFDGNVFLFGYNNKPFDYGYTLVMEHVIDNKNVYALYGHLSKKSLQGKYKNQAIEAGEIIAEIGNENENGGWPPHLHFQLSLLKPKTYDMPGVVSEAERDRALKIFPDPRNVLGAIY
ncbi:MAG: hypothetical protein CBD58_04490 [bacterium TMED198]|nr:MAG: hypothetical protein CBD58_04490 [bacterium TMED198]